MHIEYIEEFVTFSQYMNFTKAAKVLNLSHSCLSKHTHQLETDCGFALVECKDGKPTLTPAGKQFMNKASKLIEEFHEILAECKQVSESFAECILVRDPAFNDVAARRLFTLIAEFRKECMAPFRLLKVNYMTPLQQIEDHVVDAHIIYWSGNENDLLKKFDGTEAEPLFLDEEGIVIKCTKNTYLAEKKSAQIDDLKKETFLTPNQVFDPMTDVIQNLCCKNGFEPKLERCLAESLSELNMALQDHQGILILPESIQQDIRFTTHDDTVCVPLADATLKSYLLVNSKDGAVGAFREYVRKRALSQQHPL